MTSHLPSFKGCGQHFFSAAMRTGRGATRGKMNNKNPQPINEQMADSLTLETVAEIKRSDCSFYSSCLDVAVSGDWANFSCKSCTAYQMIDQDQRKHDNLMLRVLLEASEHVMRGGNANRIRGVKPGTERKKIVRLPVIAERTEVDLSQVALAGIILG